METFSPQLLPVNIDLETREILRASIKASRTLGQLRGEAKTIPNESILISTLGLQEAKDSSAIENIITTHDELFRSIVDTNFKNAATKEVQNYAEAINYGFSLVRENSFLSVNNIFQIQELVSPGKLKFRENNT